MGVEMAETPRLPGDFSSGGNAAVARFRGLADWGGGEDGAAGIGLGRERGSEHAVEPPAMSGPGLESSAASLQAVRLAPRGSGDPSGHCAGARGCNGANPSSGEADVELPLFKTFRLRTGPGSTGSASGAPKVKASFLHGVGACKQRSNREVGRPITAESRSSATSSRCRLMRLVRWQTANGRHPLLLPGGSGRGSGAGLCSPAAFSSLLNRAQCRSNAAHVPQENPHVQYSTLIVRALCGSRGQPGSLSQCPEAPTRPPACVWGTHGNCRSGSAAKPLMCGRSP
mmetsp:Transcript_56988/g.177217  ORF Transcript_56988/g.177217 Transcript_56988/m.177217 type:complete len:285 (-) Transcript_56988:2-856(-)